MTLVLGGARSGKSIVAEGLVVEYAEETNLGVTYVATGIAPTAEDADWAARVMRHRERRPAAWRTVEVAASFELCAAISAEDGVVLVDSLGTWVAAADAFDVDVAGLCDALANRSAQGRPTVIVSEEVGMGVHPATELGRRFRDNLGDVNRAVAAASDRVLLIVAGRALELTELGRS
jgi:adenosylcobinamide kinase/adenosylcobinamide-phosphate guanylyltransferase